MLFIKERKQLIKDSVPCEISVRKSTGKMMRALQFTSNRDLKILEHLRVKNINYFLRKKSAPKAIPGYLKEIFHFLCKFTEQPRKRALAGTL